jgi:hypothetical protein
LTSLQPNINIHRLTFRKQDLRLAFVLKKKGDFNMDSAQKQAVFQKMQERSERDQLVNKGVTSPLGDENVCIKALPWLECNKFDDAVKKALSKFQGLLTVDITKEINIDDMISQIIELIHEDLPAIAEVGTRGQVTLDRIIETEATRDDVIRVVAKCFEVNYAYLKNLLALTRALK